MVLYDLVKDSLTYIEAIKPGMVEGTGKPEENLKPSVSELEDFLTSGSI